MSRLKLVRINGARDAWEVQKITGKAFTPDKSYPGANGKFFVSQESYFTFEDVKKIQRARAPFRAVLLK